ncbi:MAG: DUF3899 domain-containing protein [Clostridia bacterium]|nr:DUF3899 domain-containing protein [Clostridia bacterium]
MKRSLLIAGAVSLLAVFLIAFFRGLAPGCDAAGALSALCDGTFAVGAVLLGAGILSWVGQSGFFDIYSYGARAAWNRLTPFVKGREATPRYYDYKVKKDTERKPPMKAPLIIGLVLLFLSGLLLFFYSRVSGNV